jgi:hypothetical protein
VAHCNQCGCDWIPRVLPPSLPRACTRCKRYDWAEPKKAGVAQLGEQGLSKAQVAGSIPAPRSKVEKVKAPTYAELKKAHDKVKAIGAKANVAVAGSLGPLPESVAAGFEKDAKVIAAKVPKTTVASALHLGHDPKTCRVYKCGLCAALSQNEK